MMLRSRPLHSTLLALAVIAAPTVAQASTPGLDACGDVEVELDARCELWVDIDCNTRCEPLQFELSCAHELWATCEGMCEAELDIDCDRACTEVCVPDCQLDPGNFSCSASCELDCNASCEGYCEAQPGQAHCEASCQAACGGRCAAGCEGQLPELSCDERCADVCGARCEAEANFGCQVECQAPRFDRCQAKLSGGCQTQCEGDGALFCDGQFIDHGGKLNECIAALEVYLKSKVKVHAHADAACEDGVCQTEAEAGITCACRSGDGWGQSPWWSLGLLALLWLRRGRTFGDPRANRQDKV